MYEAQALLASLLYGIFPMIRKYRTDHKKIKVYCPCCRKIMSGWAKDRGWDKYWIAHQRPSKNNIQCWATKEQMRHIKKEWERKYEDGVVG